MKRLVFIITILLLSVKTFAIGSIIGDNKVCQGTTITLSDTTAGGIWSSSNTSVAGVGSSTGIATGVSAGTATITYTVGTAYVIKAITVNALPLDLTVNDGTYVNINGGCPIAMPLTTSAIYYRLFHIAGFPISGGIFFGTGSSRYFKIVVPDTFYVIATDTATGCSITMSDTAVVIWDTAMEVTGTASVSVGATTTLGNATSGGSWSSSNPSVASVGTGSGVVTGVTTGTAVISYMLPSACFAVKAVTVNPSTLLAGNNAAKEVHIYPSPTSGKLTFEPSGNDNYNIEIFNLLGQRVFQSIINSTSEIDITRQTRGVYLIHIRSGNQNWIEKMFVE